MNLSQEMNIEGAAQASKSLGYKQPLAGVLLTETNKSIGIHMIHGAVRRAADVLLCFPFARQVLVGSISGETKTTHKMKLKPCEARYLENFGRGCNALALLELFTKFQ